jgi:hypothetical protein
MEYNPGWIANSQREYVLKENGGNKKMQTIQMSPGQKQVEDLFERIKNIPVDGEKSAVAQFGQMESWIFTLGEYQFFLNPLTKSWFFFDRAHNDWKDLKAPVGSVVFQLNGTEMAILKTDVPSSSQVAPAPTVPGHRFCNQCGAQLREGLKFCNSCGAKVD